MPRGAACPLKRPCVAKAKTLRAPKAMSSLAAAHSVPAVSIISSTMMQSAPLTSPTCNPRVPQAEAAPAWDGGCNPHAPQAEAAVACAGGLPPCESRLPPYSALRL